MASENLAPSRELNEQLADTQQKQRGDPFKSRPAERLASTKSALLKLCCDSADLRSRWRPAGLLVPAQSQIQPHRLRSTFGIRLLQSLCNGQKRLVRHRDR